MDKNSTGNPRNNIADRYLDMLSGQRKLSDNTVENYRRDLEQLAELASKTALISLSSADIRRFISQLHAGRFVSPFTWTETVGMGAACSSGSSKNR